MLYVIVVEDARYSSSYIVHSATHDEEKLTANRKRRCMRQQTDTDERRCCAAVFLYRLHAYVRRRRNKAPFSLLTSVHDSQERKKRKKRVNTLGIVFDSRIRFFFPNTNIRLYKLSMYYVGVYVVRSHVQEKKTNMNIRYFCKKHEYPNMI
jgi:hypothetical protein